MSDHSLDPFLCGAAQLLLLQDHPKKEDVDGLEYELAPIASKECREELLRIVKILREKQKATNED